MVSVIIIDDEIDLVETMSEYLVSENINVIATGSNGKDAVELCIKHSPDFLLLDMKMPEYDGFYALDNLFKTENHPKIIIISGQISVHAVQLQNYGGLSLVRKPIDLREIINIIQE